MEYANSSFTVKEMGTDGDGSGRKYYYLTHTTGEYNGNIAKCSGNGSQDYYRGGVYQNKKTYRINTYSKTTDWSSTYDDAAAIAPGDADVRLPGLPRPIDHATHDGYGDLLFTVGQGLLDLVCQADQVDAGPAAGRAGDEIDACAAQTRRLENALGGDDLLHRIRRQGDADRIADAQAQQSADADGGFQDALRRGPRLRHADVERIVGLGGKAAVGRHHHGDIGGFHGNARIIKPEFLQQRQMGSPRHRRSCLGRG